MRQNNPWGGKQNTTLLGYQLVISTICCLSVLRMKPKEQTRTCRWNHMSEVVWHCLRTCVGPPRLTCSLYGLLCTLWLDCCLPASECQRVGTPERAAFKAAMINGGGQMFMAFSYSTAIAHWISLRSWRPTTHILMLRVLYKGLNKLRMNLRHLYPQ